MPNKIIAILLVSILALAIIVGFDNSSKAKQKASDDTGIIVYPNPWTPNSAESSIKFKGIQSGYKLLIYNSRGKLLYSQDCNGSVVNWDVSDVAYGVYLYVIKDGSGKIRKQGKIVITK